jgi:hypothetical protein
MLWGWIYIFLVLTAAIYVFAMGSHAAKYAISILFLANALTAAAYGFGTHKWLPMNHTVLIVDTIALVLFGVLAARSDALWPLFVLGWQIATVMIHIVSLFAKKLVPDAYGIGQGIWAYLQFATIFGATLIESRRTTRNYSQEHLENEA